MDILDSNHRDMGADNLRVLYDGTPGVIVSLEPQRAVHGRPGKKDILFPACQGKYPAGLCCGQVNDRARVTERGVLNLPIR